VIKACLTDYSNQAMLTHISERDSLTKNKFLVILISESQENLIKELPTRELWIHTEETQKELIETRRKRSMFQEEEFNK
jgi:hypothetical protein